MIKKAGLIAICGIFGMLLTGCCTTCAKPAPGCGKFISPNMCDCIDFISEPDPCADGTCSAREREEYFLKGYACAKKLGMVPLSPKYGKPALECPVEYVVDANVVCPPRCAAPEKEVVVSQQRKGFLFTAYDTPAGVKYIMVEAEQKFNPETKFEDVALDMSGVAQKVKEINGTVAVYSTEFPLITPPANMTSRLPTELEISDIKQQSKLLGKAGDEMIFIRWK